MSNELLPLIKKHIDTLVEQTKTKPQQETPEIKMVKQMEWFSFNPPFNLAEESKWLLAVTRFETTSSVFIIIDENNIFSISTPSVWNSEDGEDLINKLKKYWGSDLKTTSNNIKKNLKKRYSNRNRKNWL